MPSHRYPPPESGYLGPPFAGSSLDTSGYTVLSRPPGSGTPYWWQSTGHPRQDPVTIEISAPGGVPQMPPPLVAPSILELAYRHPWLTFGFGAMILFGVSTVFGRRGR